MAFKLYLPLEPGASELGFVASFATAEEAIAAATEPGATVEKEIIGGSTIIFPEPEIEASPDLPAAVRARDGLGQFIADDPATPADEAWVTP
jgi:hypothetical protein